MRPNIEQMARTFLLGKLINHKTLSKEQQQALIGDAAEHFKKAATAEGDFNPLKNTSPNSTLRNIYNQ